MRALCAGARAPDFGLPEQDGGVQDLEAFADDEQLDFPLLADAEGAVARPFGVRRRFPTPVRRATFVIGEDQRIAEGSAPRRA